MYARRVRVCVLGGVLDENELMIFAFVVEKVVAQSNSEVAADDDRWHGQEEGGVRLRHVTRKTMPEIR